jgi:SAM-dependent methyltransferase
LALFAARGWEAHGVDVCRTAVEMAQQRGLKCACSSIEDYRPGVRFDAIVMSHVLEHCPNPLAVLRRMREWLAADGTAHIRVPNLRSWILRRGEVFFRGEVKPFEHLFYFDPLTLKRLLEMSGFECAIHTEGRGSLGDALNLLIRSRLISQAGWQQINFFTEPARKTGYLRLKRLYERGLSFLRKLPLGPADRELCAVAHPLMRKAD